MRAERLHWSRHLGARNAGYAVSTALQDPAARDLFALLWDSLSDILGVSATATLLRRALQRAVVHDPMLAALIIRREGLAYRYSLPSGWEQGEDGQALTALRALTEELYPLLMEMTGLVVLRRIARIEALRRANLAPGEEVGV